MLTVGDKFPSFSLTASPAVNFHKFETISSENYKGMWKIIFFWPKDFTFVCPTEMVDFNNHYDEFLKNNTQLLGCSTDNEFVHAAWKEANPALSGLKYPLMSDIKRELSSALGIIDKNAGVCQRAAFIVDNENTIRSAIVTDLSVGRSAKEVLRILKALQTGELCPANWQEGEAVIKL
jgi:peroxiredoxin (alkyl hydroperoxide reductase subunit C)